MAHDETMAGVITAIRAAGGDEIPEHVGADDSLVLHLGFDSMKIALLSLALEREFNVMIALDEWLGSHNDPQELTVRSLCDHVEEVQRVDAPKAASW
jgi:acyl carrier protein